MYVTARFSGFNKLAITKFVVMTLAILLAGMLMHGGKASAVITGFTPGPMPAMPSSNYTYIVHCDERYPSTHETPAYTSWISLAGNSAATTKSVPVGTAFVDLQYNNVGLYCANPSKTTEEHVLVNDADVIPGGSVNGIVSPTHLTLNFAGAGAPVGTNDSFARPFKLFAPAGGFTAGSHPYTVNVTTYPVALVNGTYYCVVGGAPVVPQGWNNTKCPPDIRPLSVQITGTPTGDPKGTLTYTCSADNLSATVKGTFSDPDGATSGYITAGGIKYATFPSPSGTWTIPVPAGGVSVVLSVKDTGSASGAYMPVFPLSVNCGEPICDVTTDPDCCTNPDAGGCEGCVEGSTDPICCVPATDPACCDPATNPACGGGGTTTCSGQSTAQSVTVDPVAPSSGAPSGTTPSQGDTQYQKVPGKYTLTSAHDEYSPATNIDTNSPIGTWQASSTFSLDYTNYVNTYPYDSHATTVTYKQQYDETTWKATTFDHYDGCGSATCTTDAGQTCTTDAAGVKTCVDNACPPGYGGSGGANCSYSATAFYAYAKGSTVTKETAVYSNSTAPVLRECYRNFTVQDAPDSDVLQPQLSPSDDDPTTVNFSSTIKALFTLPTNFPIHFAEHPMQVNDLTYSGHYYVLHADGTQDPLYSKQSDTISRFHVGNCNAHDCTANGPYNMSASISLPPLLVGDRICAQFTVSPKTGQVTQAGDIVGGSGSGQVDSTAIPNDPTCSARILNSPYVRVYGNDVLAGGAFATGSNECLGTPVTGGQIRTRIKSGGANPRGSAGQFAALGVDLIDQFASASLRNSSPTGTTGLTFANSSGTGSYGGSMGANYMNCVPDYFATKPGGVTMDTTSFLNMSAYNGVGVAAAPAQWFNPTGGILDLRGFNGGGDGIAKGNSVAIYVEGNVHIDQDIKFKKADQPNEWTTRKDIPSFYLIVKGNIYIDPDVRQLDGVYVAQNGTIDTCADSSGTIPIAQVYDACNSQLVVNGAFVANRVSLNRARASLRNSLPGERPQTATGDCISTGNNPAPPAVPQRTNSAYDCAAEVFRFSPELYLGTPSLTPSSGPSMGKYDSITSLSPVL